MRFQASPSFWRFLVLGMLVLNGFFIREVLLLPDGKTHIYFLDVGQGDSALIVTPSGKQILIDGGPDLSALESLEHTMPFFDRTIDLLVLSHPHLDHLASFPEILMRYKVKGILFSGTDYSMSRYQQMLDLLPAEGAVVIGTSVNRDVVLDENLKLQVLWPPSDWYGKPIDNVNDASAVVRLTDGKHSALFTGDIETSTETMIMKTGAQLQSDILKVPHHGSSTSSSTGFLLAVDPDFAVISVGTDNQFGHPKPEIVKRYEHFGIPVRRTDLEGMIEIVWK